MLLAWTCPCSLISAKYGSVSWAFLETDFCTSNLRTVSNLGMEFTFLGRVMLNQLTTYERNTALSNIQTKAIFKDFILKTHLRSFAAV